MEIAGIQRLSLLDWPGKVVATVFLPGCNFACPYCHNAKFIPTNIDSTISESELLRFLFERQRILDGVCVSGGEPTIQKEINSFCKKIHQLGFLVKLDTNGSNPQVVKSLIKEELIDAVSLDIKNTWENYPTTAKCAKDTAENVQQTLKILKSSGIEWMTRTTVVKEFHTPEDLVEIAKTLEKAGAPEWRLQEFVSSDGVPDKSLTPIPISNLKAIAETFPKKLNVTFSGD